jgi:secreted PhoX family phosphatase
LNGRYNRRITANTPMQLTVPLRATSGSAPATTRRDAGARDPQQLRRWPHPWGTVLSCEENFNGYFGNLGAVKDPTLAASHRRYGLSDEGFGYRWPWVVHRFNMGIEPNEPNRHGWVVEIDPLDPRSTPKKRTALGRFKHEGAVVAISRAGKACVYSGDDERFDYAYKFISDGTFDPRNRATGRDILDRGTLHVARFDDDGSGEWIPLVHSDPRLAGAFGSQAEVLIRTREAADLVGATKMDRPEDFQRDPVSGRVYLALTNNTNRGNDGQPGPDAANPRAKNAYGHIIELTETNADPGELRFSWQIFMLCGPEGDPTRRFGSVDPATVGSIANPDNLTFDSYGNLWISTDGQPGSLKENDTLQACPTAGPDRGRVKRFLTAPKGAEVTGPCFTPPTPRCSSPSSTPARTGRSPPRRAVGPTTSTGSRGPPSGGSPSPTATRASAPDVPSPCTPTPLRACMGRSLVLAADLQESS